MKRKKGLRNLTILISLFIFLLPVYSSYFTLVEMNFTPADISYESPDQDGLAMNLQGELRGFASSAPSVSFLSPDNLFKWLIDSSCQTLSTDQRPFVPRC